MSATLTPPAAPTRLKGGDLARLAGIWCNDAAFQAWMGATDSTVARNKICFLCGVQSRADIDHNRSAAQIFNQAIREQYRLHLLTARRA